MAPTHRIGIVDCSFDGTRRRRQRPPPDTSTIMSELSSFPPTHAALMPLPEASDALAVGTLAGEFEIREVVGVGGFGIVYRAWEPVLEREVALKEYMPMGLVTRGDDGLVALRSRQHEDDFRLGLKSFVNEARLLARFDHPALVKVHRFWEANGTAYMAMPFYNARTLRQRRQENGLPSPTQDWLISMIEPLLGALAEMHRADVYHRDIAPDNILWCVDNRPVLLDFGAARHVLADRTQSLTAILKPHFAPIEQYADARSMRQGPWTDVFALASTCYFMLTGHPPLPATARVLSDDLVPLVELAPAGFSTQVLAALDWAMNVHPEHRPQSVAAFWDALHGHATIPPRPEPPLSGRQHSAALPRRFERTIQTSARWDGPRSSSFSMLHPTLGPALTRLLNGQDAPGGVNPARMRPAMWLLSGAAALAAVAAVLWQHPASQEGMTAGAQAPVPAAAPSAGGPGVDASIPNLVVRDTTTSQPAVASDPSAGHGQPPTLAAPETSDPIMQAERDWAATHAASAPPATPRRSGLAKPVGAGRHASPFDACRKGTASDTSACIQRVCDGDPRLRREDTCAGTTVPLKRWWQFWKAG